MEIGESLVAAILFAGLLAAVAIPCVLLGWVAWGTYKKLRGIK